MAPVRGTVLVTGSTGHLGSWLVMRLLERGYHVRAAVLDKENKEDLAPLLSLPPTLASNLEILQADLLVEGDYDAAVRGCDGVFHLACPTNCIVEDPQRDAIDPSVQGTLRVLKACTKSPSVKRIVHASSAAAIRFSGPEVPNKVFDESCWTDVDYCIKSNVPGWMQPYFVAKTLGEKAAVEFAERNNLDLVVLNPTVVNGPFLLSRIPNSVNGCLSLIIDESFQLDFFRRLSYVHIDDVVEAFIYLFENTSAKGRYICSAVDASTEEVASIISSHHPEFNIPIDFSHLGEPVLHYFDSSKLRNLGFKFKFTLEDMYKDAIKCCKEKGLLKGK